MSRKSRVIEFNIDRVDFPNKGKGSFEERNIRIKGGLPGQKVKAKVSKRRIHENNKKKVMVNLFLRYQGMEWM